MKLNKYMLLAATALALVFTGCKSHDPFDTQSPDDYPRILLPVNESGTGTFTYTLDNPDVPFHDSCIVTPSDYTTVQWLLDNHVVSTRLHINMCLPAGKYDLKIVATTTAGKSTSRFGTVTVRPYDFDPYSEKVGNERTVAPGTAAILVGQNLSLVKKIVLMAEYPWAAQGNYAPARTAAEAIEVTDFSATDAQIDYTVPADLAAGIYYVALYDEADKLHGGNTITVTSTTLVLDGYADANEGGDIKLTGLFMNQIQSLKLEGEGGNFELNVVNATEKSLSVALPEEAKAGKYTLTGVLTDGAALRFATANGIVEAVEFKITPSGETVIWTGPSAPLAWSALEFKDEALAALGLEAGNTVTVYYTADEGAQGAIATTWWNAINTGAQWETPEAGGIKTDLTAGEGTLEYKITTMEYIAEQGFAVIGNGFVVDKITKK